MPLNINRRIAAVAVAVATAGCAPIAAAGHEPVAPTRYFDIEANKAANMRALGLHMAEQRGDPALRYDDIEANKARNQRAR